MEVTNNYYLEFLFANPFPGLRKFLSSSIVTMFAMKIGKKQVSIVVHIRRDNRRQTVRNVPYSYGTRWLWRRFRGALLLLGGLGLGNLFI